MNENNDVNEKDIQGGNLFAQNVDILSGAVPSQELQPVHEDIQTNQLSSGQQIIMSSEQVNSGQVLTADSVQNSQLSLGQQINMSSNQEQLSSSSEVSDNNLGIANSDGESNKTNKKNLKFVIPLLIIILLLGGIFVFYHFFLMNEKTIVKKSFSSFFSLLTDRVNDLDKNHLDFDIEKESLSLDGNVSFQSEYKSEEIDLSKLKDYSIHYGGVINKSGNNLSGRISLNKESNPILAVDGYLNGKEFLLKSEQLISKILKTNVNTELKDFETSSSFNYDNVRILLEKTEKITIDTIDDKKITKSLVDKKINNKEEKVMKVTYVMDENVYIEKLLKGYLEDDKVLTILAELSNQKNDDIKEVIQSYLNSKDNSNSSKKIILDFYLDKIFGTLKEFDISEEDSFNGNSNVTKFIVVKDNKNYQYSLVDGDVLILSGTYDVSIGKLTMVQKDRGEEINVTLEKIKDNSYKVDVTYSQKDMFFIRVNATMDSKLSSTTQSSNVVLSLEYKTEQDDIKLNVISNSSLSKGKEVTAIDANNVVDISELSDEDFMQIYGNLSNVLDPVIKDFVPNYDSSSIMQSIY